MKESNFNCPLCKGANEVVERPARLIGATYFEDDIWMGDEHIEPCPLCKIRLERQIAIALFNPGLLGIYPEMRWENLPEEIRDTYLNTARRILTVIKINTESK